jgi:hypothetical protein
MIPNILIVTALVAVIVLVAISEIRERRRWAAFAKMQADDRAAREEKAARAGRPAARRATQSSGIVAGDNASAAGVAAFSSFSSGSCDGGSFGGCDG